MPLKSQQTQIAEQDQQADWLEAIARDKSRTAFAELFGWFAPRLKSYLMRLGSEPAAAEEVMQDVMLTVWRKASQFDRQRASASTWIFRIARNRRIDLHRKASKPAPDPNDSFLHPAETEQPDITVQRAQADAQVRRAMETLPEEQLTLLRAAFYEGLSHTQIAKEFDLPLGTVKSRIRLAFNRLKGQVDEP